VTEQGDDQPGTAPADSMFEPIVGTRMSMTIADQIRSRIRSGQLPTGTRLPAERELCRQFGVARLTVREALRVLEGNGLVVIKLGKEGGAFVSAPSANHVTEGITDMLTTSALDSADVTEARVVVELGFLPFACERATDDDLARLRAICDRDEQARVDGTYTVDMSFGFHLQVAVSTHNPAAVILLNAFREPILRSLNEAHHLGTAGVSEHRDLVAAIEARDPERAYAVMVGHLERTVSRFRDSD
jgi:GntR family transcriptional repressor for pyruvate dehydrogenase complex